MPGYVYQERHTRQWPPAGEPDLVCEKCDNLQTSATYWRNRALRAEQAPLTDADGNPEPQLPATQAD